ncbi:sodium-dependent multivitamin transporter isoform X8 [Ptiloglossa arizonensis]|uniref:sodium-dependent multivitamin transporter isoform X8 n=1 Tax=Ptiloglossa arizonensis TaxID=3350558 RepID=UPI003F9F8256
MDRGDASSARRSFEPIDCAVFAGMLAISAIVGVYQAYKSRKNTDAVGEYLMGGRNMSIFPISMSLIASYVSGIAILGLPAEIYVHGTQFWCVIVADSLVSLTMAFVYLPVFYDLGIDSSYEYLKLRFNNAVRLTGTVIFLLKMVSSNRPRSSAVEILPRETLVPVALHSAGDIRSRAGVQSSDGHQPPRDRSTGLHRLHILHDLGRAQGGRVDRRYSNDRHVRRSGDRRGSRDVAGRRGPTSLGEKPRDRQNRLLRHGSGPDGAAHLLDRGRRRLLQLVGELLGQPGNGAEMLVDARREEGQRRLNKPDQLLPYFVMEMADSIPGLPGLFVAGVFSAALSTMSTGLNAMSGVIYGDMIKPWLREPVSETTAGRTIKATVVAIGALCVGLVFLVEKLTGLIQVNVPFAPLRPTPRSRVTRTSVLVPQAGKSLSGITAGPLLGMFTLGMFFPCANSAGALVGGLVSLNLVAWISFGTQAAISAGRIAFPAKPVSVDGCSDALKARAGNLTILLETATREQPFFLYRMSYLWYTWVGFLTAVLLGLLVSWITGANQRKPGDEKLYTPVVRRFLRSNRQDDRPVELDRTETRASRP